MAYDSLFELKPVLDMALDAATSQIRLDMKAFAFHNLLFAPVGEKNARTVKFPHGDPIGPLVLWPKGDPRPVHHLNMTYWEVEPDRYSQNIGIDRDDLRRDPMGWLRGKATELAVQAKYHGPQLAHAEILAAATNAGFEGQPLFSATHHTSTGSGSHQSNIYNGGGDRTWFLACCNIPGIKPFGDWLEMDPLYTDLEADIASKHNQEELEWGVTTWRKMIPLYWPLAYACNQTLNASNVETCAAAMRARKDTISGQYFGYWPTHLFFDSRDRKAAMEVCAANLTVDTNAAGGTNVTAMMNLIPVEIPALGDLSI